MRSSRYILSASLLALLITASVQAQVNDTYVIPVSANASGDFGTTWATELNIFNPQAYDLNVRLVFQPTLTGTGAQATIPVDANSNAWSPNILRDVFGASGTGSLLIATFPEDNPGVPDDILSRSFLVNSKIYNNASSGTYGQYVPGLWAGLLDFELDGISSIAHGIRNGAGSNFRTNIGAANLGRSTARILVAVYDALGNRIETIPFTVPFFGHVQERLPTQVDRGSVEFFLDDPTGDAVVFPYASVVDNRSGDAVFMPPVLLAEPSILFKKGAAAKAAAMNGTLGKKLDTAMARQVAAQAVDLGRLVTSADATGRNRIRFGESPSQ